MKRTNLARNTLLCGLACLVATTVISEGAPRTAPIPPVNANSLKQWQDDKFGLFIHWGLFSKTAGYWKDKQAKSSGHIMLYERIPVKKWADIAKDFDPVDFDADEWVLAAKRAGMKYLVITTKHHDGLAMFDSPSSDYDLIDKSPYKTDPIKALADACHRHGIRLGFYYSLGRDWEDPNARTNWPKKGGRSNTWDYPDEDAKVFHKYYLRKVKPQVTELLSSYGKVDLVWFDTPEMISRQESQELRELIHSLQPDCIINDRIGNKLGDFTTREQNIGGIDLRPWESCITMAKHWNYDLDEKGQYKSPELLVHQLLEIVSKGGNYLLNVGPTAEGRFPDDAVERLGAIGKWMAVNGEGVYGTRPWKIDRELLAEPAKRTKPASETPTGAPGEMKDAVNDATSKVVPSEVRFTTKDRDLYFFVFNWNKDTALIKSLSRQNGEILELDMLGHEGAVSWKQTDTGLELKLPPLPDPQGIPVRGFNVTLK